MGLLEYAALAGLERFAIIAGSVILGYWGYKLFLAEKKVGQIFMAMSALVLIGALATGSSHVRSVGESYRLAASTMAPAAEVGPAAEPVPIVDAESGDVAELAEAIPFQEPVAMVSPVIEIAAETGTIATVSVGARDMTATDTTNVERDPPLQLATGEELGGRILSVKSEKVSLEWSSGSD